MEISPLFEFCSRLVDLVVGVGRDLCGGHRLALIGERFVGRVIVTASPRVVIGADTHLDSHHLAVITDAGKPLADNEFPTSQTGYGDAVRSAQSFGTIVIAGVGGTSSYGAGLTGYCRPPESRLPRSAAPIGSHATARANRTRWMPTPLRAPRWAATASPCPKTQAPAPCGRC